MRRHLLPFVILAATALVAGCGSVNKGDDDDDGATSPTPTPTPTATPTPTPAFDYSCEDDAAPTTALDPIVISGVIQELALSGITPTVGPVADATVTAFPVGSGTPSGSDVTGADGAYSISVATSATPYDGYVRVTRMDDRTTNVVPANPLTQDASLSTILFSNAAFSAVTMFASVSQNDASNGALAIQARDCAGVALSTATVTVKQGGVDVGEPFDLGTVDPGSAGTVVVFNVPAGATEIGGTADGHVLRAHTVTVIAGETVSTFVRPGFVEP